MEVPYPSATARTVMSRSVIMPTNRPLSQTGSGPTSSVFIRAAASCKELSGPMVSTEVVMTSCTCMGSLLGPCGPFTIHYLLYLRRRTAFGLSHQSRMPSNYLLCLVGLASFGVISDLGRAIFQALVPAASETPRSQNQEMGGSEWHCRPR